MFLTELYLYQWYIQSRSAGEMSLTVVPVLNEELYSMSLTNRLKDILVKKEAVRDDESGKKQMRAHERDTDYYI